MNATELRTQAASLRLHGLLAHWPELMVDPEAARRVAQWLGWEAAERGRRSLERRVREAHIGRFKPLAACDWSWPAQIDRAAVDDLMTLLFLTEASNVVLVGHNGVGKTMCACNLGYQAVLAGHTALFVTTGQLLGDLAALDSDSALRRRLRHYAAPDLLLIDEVGYLVLEPPRRFAVRARQPPLPTQEHRRHHQPGLRRMGRGVPQCGLRRLAGRSPHAPRRGRAHRGPLLPCQGSRGAVGRPR